MQSQDALSRATAARVAFVRDAKAAVPALRTALAAESDAEAALETVRAIALLGSDDDVAFAATQLSRFPQYVDEAFVDGIARSGMPRALELYLRHRASLRNAPLPGVLPHWRSDLHVTPTAARLLQARDAGSFSRLLGALEDAHRKLDPGVASVAAASEDEAIRAALQPRPAPNQPLGTAKGTEIPEPPFRLPLVLPRGLGTRILADTGCASGWLGVTMVQSDHAGRIQNIDTSKVRALGRCVDALQTIARLSLATPTRLGAGTTAPLLVVRDARTPPCFDQTLAAANATGGEIRPPQVEHRVEPLFGATTRSRVRSAVEVDAEAFITADGCVRDVRLRRQSPYPDINGAVVLALSKWTFKPATQNGVPVDTIFTMRTSFGHR